VNQHDEHNQLSAKEEKPNHAHGQSAGAKNPAGKVEPASSHSDHAAMRHGSMAGMSGGDHGQMMYRESLWASFVNLLLGVWLIASPPTLGYGGSLALSDYASGALIIALSAFALFCRHLADVRAACLLDEFSRRLFE
jgi:hypothetical protein